MVMHEDISQDGEIMGYGGFVDSGGEQLADLIIPEIGLAVVSGKCQIVRVAKLIDEPAGLEFLGLTHVKWVLPFLHRHLSTGNSQLRRRRYRCHPGKFLKLPRSHSDLSLDAGVGASATK